MRFQYLGTAAAEGWPGIFCNCSFCKEAIKRGGRNIRTRSQSIINDDLLLDLPPDTYMHKLQYGLDLTKVRHLLITHNHMDHFFPQEMAVRSHRNSHDMVEHDLHIYCAQEVEDWFDLVATRELDDTIRPSLHFHILHPFEPVKADNYTITPLPAHHMKEGSQPFVYLIEDQEGHSVLYLHDSGYYSEEVWDFFASLPHPVDMVSYDSTSGEEDTHGGTHMGLPEVMRVKDRMLEIGAIDAHTLCVANHFSHNGHLLYEELLEAAAEKLLISYDGMTLEF